MSKKVSAIALCCAELSITGGSQESCIYMPQDTGSFPHTIVRWKLPAKGSGFRAGVFNGMLLPERLLLLEMRLV